MKTLDLKPELSPGIATGKSLPPLALLVIRPSSCLQILLTLFYGVFLVAVWVLLWPYGSQYWVWMLLPLLSLVVLVSWRRQWRNIGITQGLWFERGQWFLESGGIQLPVYLSGEILVWPRVIILGFTSGSTTRGLHLVVMRDSVGENDFRRLSRWLRVCLKPGD